MSQLKDLLSKEGNAKLQPSALWEEFVNLAKGCLTSPLCASHMPWTVQSFRKSNWNWNGILCNILKWLKLAKDSHNSTPSPKPKCDSNIFKTDSFSSCVHLAFVLFSSCFHLVSSYLACWLSKLSSLPRAMPEAFEETRLSWSQESAQAVLKNLKTRLTSIECSTCSTLNIT